MTYEILDRKEQVLELQMTQYGKALMSRGVFQPAYYAFLTMMLYMTANICQLMGHWKIL